MICAKCTRRYDEKQHTECPFCSGDFFDASNSKKRIKKINITIKRKDEHSISGQTIQEMFSDNKYAWFVRYCNRHGISTFGELESFDYSKLINEKGVGVTKLNALINQYHYLLNVNESDSISDEDADEKVFVNEQLWYLDSQLLKSFGMNTAEFNKLKRKQIFKLGDFRQVSKSDAVFLSQIGYMKYHDYLTMSLSDLTEAYLNELSKNRDYSLFLARLNGQTLQEISDSANLTRERVRQIVSSYMRKVTPVFGQIRALLAGDNVISKESIDLFFGDLLSARIFEYWLINMCSYRYVDYLSIYASKTWVDDYENAISLYLGNYVDEEMQFLDLQENINAYLNQMGSWKLDDDALKLLLRKYNYYVYGETVFSEKPTYGLLCALIIRDHYPDGLKLYDGETLDNLRELVKTKYGNIEMPDNNRSLSNRITKYTVLSGRGAVTAKENVYIDVDLLDEIKTYIDSLPSKEIYYSDLFASFEGKLKMLSNIDNYYFLHGALKLFFPEDYNYRDRDYLSKSGGKGTSVHSFSQRLNEIIINENRPLSKKELKNYYPGLTDIRLATAVSSSESLLSWDYNQYFSLDCITYTEETIKYVQNAIDELCLDNRYCGSGLLFDYLANNNKELLEETQINNPSSLYYFCAKLFNKQYGFKKPNIFLDKSIEKKETIEVVDYMLGKSDRLTYQFVLQTAKKQKWPDSTCNAYLCELENRFVRTGIDDYLRKELFLFDREKLSEISSCINSHMTDGFFSLISFDDWNIFPQIGFKWNPILLKSLVDSYLPEYKIIETKQTDRRYVRAFIVPTSDADDGFKEFFYNQIVETLGQGSYDENDLVNYCILRGLIYKTIPKEVLDNPKITKVNNKWVFN